MIYCKPIPDEEILPQLENSKEILLLGCSLCANISYCIEKNIEMPMYNWLLNPKAVKNEINRLENILSGKNFEITTLVLLSLCFIRDTDQKKLLQAAENIDTIITLSCEYGSKNISDIIDGKIIVSAMKSSGFMRAAVEQKGGKLFVKKDRLYINNKKYEE
jgi:hypothetical protein